MKVLHIASEAVPLVKTGGLADVAGILPGILAGLGCDVRLVLPRYRAIRSEGFQKLPISLGVPLGPKEEWGAVWQGSLPDGTPVFLLEHDSFYGRPELYGSPGGAYEDNLSRFAFLSRGALQLCHAMAWFPDIIHLHDWQTALVPVYLHTVERHSPLGRAASILTIHNMDYQGNFPAEQMPLTGLGWEHFNYMELEFHDRVSLLKGGIVHATEITTVSPTYAIEIQGSLLGRGLETSLAQRNRPAHGILNGIDYTVWDPSHDSFLSRHYDRKRLAGKKRCKADLQRIMGLEKRSDLPLFGLVTRLAWQKGVDVLAKALSRLMELDAQFCILGAGDPWAERFFEDISKRWPGKAASFIGYSEELAHKIYAGADFFLMPSRYEPCGLGQLYALRYGALPVVRDTGGLADTVENYDESTGNGTGFKFADLNPRALFDAMGRATSTYHHKPTHIARMRAQGMALRFEWERSARQYFDVYRMALQRRKSARMTDAGIGENL